MADAAPVIEASHLSKRFCRDLRRSLRYGLADIGADLVGRGRRHDAPLRQDEFDAVTDVSFALRPGESLAIVGGNGAGKTTLLKLLYGLLKPDGGEVRVHGRIGAIVELGTGFDPILSGRENIALNATMVGFGGRDLHGLVDDVVEFAELEDAIDTPVRYYSSGMQARLAFAVAAHLEPEVLLVDEVLAVGDLAFQRKCVRHMLGYLERGGSLVFVSHNAHEIQTVCRRGMLLEDGRCTFTGTALEAVARYHSALDLDAGPDPSTGAEPDAARPVVVERVLVSPADDATPAGEPLRVTVAVNSIEAVDVVWGFGIWTSDQWVCVTGDFDSDPRRLEPGRSELTCTVPSLPLAPGTYSLRCHVVDATTLHPFEPLENDRNTTRLTVAGDESLRDNFFAMNGMLVRVDVDWGSR